MLNLFDDLGIPDDKLHQKFKTIRNNCLLTGEIEVLNDWVQGFIDRDNKIVKEFQTTFHSAFWEFYLYALFKEAGLNIDFSKNRPDFVINSPIDFYVEAVVSNIKEDALGEDSRTMGDILSMIEPTWLQKDFDENLNESITRYSSAFSSKCKKYTEYCKDKDWNPSNPYVIALCGYERINYGNSYNYAMIALLYGEHFNAKKDKYDKKQTIIKPGTNASIPLGLFLSGEYAHISAVIFSCTITIGKLTSLAISQKKSALTVNSVICVRRDEDEPKFKLNMVSSENPEYLTDGVFVFHNPFAKNPLPKDIFDNTNVVHYEFDLVNKYLCAEGNNLPIVSRLSLAGGQAYLEHIIPYVGLAFNPDLVFVSAKVINISFCDEEKKHNVTFQDRIDLEITYIMVFDTSALLRYSVNLQKKFDIIFRLPSKYRGDTSVLDLDELTFDRWIKFRKIICSKTDLAILVHLS